MSELVFTKQRYVSSAFIDSSLKMGIAQSVLMIQDNVTECFYTLGCDGVLYREKLAHLQSSVFKLSKDLIDSIHEEGIVAYTS